MNGELDYDDILHFPEEIVVEKINDFYLVIAVQTVWGIERSGFFNGQGKWAKGFENQMV